jgi:histidinol-phosphate aminotransferase
MTERAQAGSGHHGFRFSHQDAGLLGSNEAWRPPSNAVQRAMAPWLGRLNRYPDPDCSELRGALAHHFNVEPAQVAIGNGASELLYLIADAALSRRPRMVFPWPSYYAYPRLAQIHRAEPVMVALDRRGANDVVRIANRTTEGTGLVCICSPNNPTGGAIGKSAIAEALPHIPSSTTVVIDQAYIEYADPDGGRSWAELLTEFSNLVLLRTFSKARRLAGLRVGFALFSDTDLPEAIERIRPPFAVNALAQAAATAALDQADELRVQYLDNRNQRAELEAGLRDIGFIAWPSEGNFLWVSLPDEIDDRSIARSLEELGLFISPGSELCGVNGLRITCGSPEENTGILTALRPLAARHKTLVHG